MSLRTDDGKTFPASLMKPGKTLNILMDETAEERAILGIYRKKGGKKLIPFLLTSVIFQMVVKKC